MSKNIQIIDQLIFGGIIALVFLLPIFFLPITANFYEFNKQALLLVMVALLLILTSFRFILTKTVKFKTSPFDLPLLLWVLSFIIATLWRSSNKFEAFTQPGGTGTMILLLLLYFLITSHFKKENLAWLFSSFILSGVVLSLAAVAQFLGLGGLTAVDWLKPKFWTPAGGLLPLASFLAVALTLAGSTLIQQIRNRLNRSVKFVYLSVLSVSLIGVALAISIYQLTTTAKPILLPQLFGWQIAIETLKVSPLVGVGPLSFLTAFTQFKPLSFNQTDLWSFYFGFSSNFYFHLLTTVGLLGLGTFVFLVLRTIRTRSVSSVFISVISVFLILAFLPPNFLLLFALFILLALAAVVLPGKEYEESSQVLPWAISVPLVLLAIFSLLTFGRIYQAEYHLKKSLEALSRNQGAEAYNLQIKAISLNPNQPQYRTLYSQTNFALASAISQKPDLSDQDRQNISILIQQAIREAKTAVTLNPENVAYWENLALTYRRLINFAQGADEWTISAYNQTLALDPFNPNLRLSLGGVYYSLNRWEEAIRLFEQSISLKPDFANGYYNLAAAYREKGDFEKAAFTMEQTLGLVVRDSEDWKKATGELEALKKRLAQKPPASPAGGPETLQPPEPLPEGIKPPISLPAGFEPEIAPLPTPETTPTP